MIVVYDWVGFLIFDVVSFVFCDFLGIFFVLSRKVEDRCIIFMVNVLYILLLFELDEEI